MNFRASLNWNRWMRVQKLLDKYFVRIELWNCNFLSFDEGKAFLYKNEVELL